MSRSQAKNFLILLRIRTDEQAGCQGGILLQIFTGKCGRIPSWTDFDIKGIYRLTQGREIARELKKDRVSDLPCQTVLVIKLEMKKN